ncbi:MAG: helix-turn-helix domain-containing protein [Pseudonocardiaceae bacterium]
MKWAVPTEQGDDAMSLPENLKALRADRRWTQQQAADRAGVMLRNYQRWEGGEREPKIDGLKALAEAFKVSIDYLVRG